MSRYKLISLSVFWVKFSIKLKQSPKTILTWLINENYSKFDDHYKLVHILLRAQKIADILILFSLIKFLENLWIGRNNDMNLI